MMNTMKETKTGAKAMKATRLAWAISLLLAVTAMGCAQDQPDINRVQPEGIEKSALDGEWYFRATVVEAPALAASVFPGAQSSLERGIFDIHEDMLYFYRTYEYTTGAEVIGQTSDTDVPLLDENGQPVTRKKMVNGVEVDAPVYVFRGSPVASWPISKHFDVIRSYNVATGEDTNVIKEDSDDQKWYDREWIRVMWTGALHTWDSPYGWGNARLNGGTQLYPGSSTDGIEAPVFVEGEEGGLDYFDVTSRMVAQAPSIYYPYYGFNIPLCYFYPWAYGQVFECASEETMLRFAFKAVGESDYVALDYSDKQLEKFGYYRAERPTYDEERGITYSGVSRKMVRHRIWENYVKDEEGNLDYAKMTPKPIVYYMSPDFPRELAVPSIEIAQAWSKPFTETVEFLSGTEIDHSMVILCENNSREAMAAEEAGLPTAVWNDDGTNPDAAFCDVTEDTKRYGDIRYSYMAAVNQPIAYGLLGFGPPSFDPLTGEVMSANSYSYMGAMKRSASRALSSIEMMAGVRTFLEIENGSYIKLHGYSKRLNQSGKPHTDYNAANIQEIAAGMVSPELRNRLETVGLPEDNNFAQTRMNLLKNLPEVDDMLLTDEMRMVLKDPSFFMEDVEPSKEAFDEHLSIRNWGNMAHKREHEVDEHNHAISTIYMESFADDAILGLVREYKGRYDTIFCGEFDGMYDSVLDWDVFKQVGGECQQVGAVNDEGMVCRQLDKEVAEGESKTRWVNECATEKLVNQLRLAVEEIEGLDPNATYDPASPAYTDSKNEDLNAVVLAFRNKLDQLREVFHTELWQMIYKGTQLHELGHNLGLRHNFEASTDALNFDEEYWKLKMVQDGEGDWKPVNLWQRETENQAYSKMREFQLSSVMDYTSKFNGRDRGLGKYDEAAIRYGYGGIVEVFNQPPNMEALTPLMAEPDAQNEHAELSVVPGSGDALEDALKKVHHSNYLGYFDNNLEALTDRSFSRESDLAESDVEVPYRFCSDEQAGYLPTCQRWDEGVDAFEMSLNYTDNYENYWPINGYSHNQVTWSYNNYYYGVSRYFMEMRRLMNVWVQQMVRYNTDDWWATNVSGSTDEPGVPWDQDINGGLTYTMGVYEAFNTITNAFGRPSEARFGTNPITGRYEPINYYSTTTYTNQVEVTQLDGARPFYTAYDFSGYIYSPFRAGAIYDRLVAYAALTDPTHGWMMYADGNENSTRYLTSFYTLFPKEMIRLMGSLMTSDENNYGWWTCKDVSGKVVSIARRNQFDTVPPENCEQALYPETFSVFPNSKYRMPILAALYGLAWMVDDMNYTFLDSSRLCLDGAGECVGFAEGADIAIFEDPLSGKKYKAARVGDDSVYDAAYNLVLTAEKEFSNYLDEDTGELDLEGLQDNYYLSQLQFNIGLLELVRGMHQTWDDFN
jgi:hypothetical protein